jgi:hypothetical protein
VADAGVKAVGGHQRGVGALLGDAACFEDEDLVGVGEGGQTGGAQEHAGPSVRRCGRPDRLAERGDDECFGVDVERRERVVQD